MDPNDNILRTWRALVNPETSLEVCQAALLEVTGTQSFTFEADASATPADVQHGVESGGSIILDSASPAAKAMLKTVHVGVGVVSKEEFCLGIFNAKDARARVDPVVRVCSRPRSGKGGCTNTSHAQHKLDFPGKRVLIMTPTASTATVPTFFSLPYLTLESLPSVAKMTEKLLAIKAPVAIWRAFFDGSTAAIAKIFPGFSSIASPQKIGGLQVDTSLPLKPVKEDSPSSYDLLEDVTSKVESGDEEVKEEVVQSSSPTVEAKDLLDLNEDALKGVQTALNLGVALSDEELQLNLHEDLLSSPNADVTNPVDDSDVSSDDESLLGNRSFQREVLAKQAKLAAPRDAPSHTSEKPLRGDSSIASGVDNQGSVSVMLLQQILASQATFESRIRSLEIENGTLRHKLKQVKVNAEKALSVGSTFAASHAQSSSKIAQDLAHLRREFVAKTGDFDIGEINRFKRDFLAFGPWRETISERIGSLEMDLRNEDGLLFSQVRECKSAVAAGDLGAYTIAGHTFQNEDSVLTFIQTLPGKNSYVTFPSMKDFFSLCGDPVSSLSENMVLHKATKGAEFEDTFTARVNTAHVVWLPSVFARKSTTGDAFKTIWAPAFKSYSSFSGGMKNGGRTSVERQLRKVQEMYRGQIRRRLPPNLYPQQHAVATAMADKAFLAAFDFLDATSKFYFTMLSAGLPDSTAWSNTQEMILRVHEEFEMASCEAAEEDVDAGFIWSSMMISNKVEEFQRFRWGEHPSICSMLMFSILERLGDYQVPSEDTMAAEAMEKCKANDQALQDLLEKVKKDHDVAANAVNQVKQLKEALAKEKKEAAAK